MAKGRLLICGRSGIGKTREVAEFARKRCARDWKICIALSEGDGRLGELSALPPDLADAKLLLIIDNLHSRPLARAESSAPYAERLEAFLASLARQVPDNLLVIAMARSESSFERELGLDVRRESWRSFGVYQLPGFTLAGLEKMLAVLVAQAKVAVDEGEISKLVENSDRKPRTLFINVNLAYKNATPLTGANWGPNEGDLWKESFVAVRGKHPVAGKVYAALRLLADAGLPKRKGYVAALSGAVAGADTTPAIDGLVDKGLLGLRQGMLTAFSEEQLVELLHEENNAAIKLSEHWEAVISTVKDARERPPEWQADLVALVFGLIRGKLPARAEEVASFAIEQSAGFARAYVARAGARLLRGNWSGSESDLTATLKRDSNDADAHFLRGVTRQMLGDFPGMATDMDNAIKHGRNDSMAYASRGLAQYHQRKFREAEADLGAAMERGQHDSMVSFLRGVARYQLKDFAGAEGDLTAALDHGLDFARCLGSLAAIERGNVQQAIDAIEARGTRVVLAPAPPSHQDDAFLYGLRGFSRLAQTKHAEAEADLTLAIQHGFSACLGRMGAMFQQTTLPGLAAAKEQFAQAQAQFGSDAPLYYLRGITRGAQGKLPEAESDFDAALAAGFAGQELYSMRGNIRARRAKFAEAEADFDAAIQLGRQDVEVFFLRGRARLSQQSQQKLAAAEADFTLVIERSPNDAPGYFLRGAARFDRGNHAGAEEDLTAAMQRGQDDGVVYFLRGAARYNQQKLPGAEADLDLALEKGKTDIETYSMRGAARIDQGKNTEAEQDFDAVVERGRGDAAVFFVRGVARYRQQKHAEAEADLSLALEKGKTDAETYSLRGASRLTLEKWDGAEEDFLASIKNGRDDAGAFYDRGRARFGQGKFAEAEGDFDTAVARGMDDAEIYVRRGQARSSQEKLNEAEKDFTTALARGQDDAFVHLLLGLTRLGLKRYAEAEHDFDASLAKNRDLAISYHQRGRARLCQGKMEGAERDFDTAIAREPEDVEVYHLRGLARYGQGNLAGAVTDYDTALAKGEPDATILGDRVFAEVRLGRLDEAEQDCARVTDLEGNPSRAQSSLGVLHRARGEFANALTRFQSAVQAGGGPDLHFWLGLAHLFSGHLEAASAAYQKGMVESVAGDVRIALGDFEFWTAQHPKCVASEEARRVIIEIRGELANRLNA